MHDASSVQQHSTTSLPSIKQDPARNFMVARSPRVLVPNPHMSFGGYMFLAIHPQLSKVMSHKLLTVTIRSFDERGLVTP